MLSHLSFFLHFSLLISSLPYLFCREWPSFDAPGVCWCQVMSRLMNLESEYWARFVNVDDDVDADDEDAFTPASAAAPSHGLFSLSHLTL